MLTAAKVRSTTRPGVYTDGPGRYGLTLTVKVGSYGIRKVWTQRLTVDGRRTMVGIGKAEFVTLAEARQWAFENAKAAARGEPLPHGGTRRRGARAVRAVPTFAQAADAYIKLQATAWKAGSRNEANWRSSLAHAKAIANSRVDGIMTDDVCEVVARLLRAGKAPTAKAVRQRIRLVFDWCVGQGYRSDNPANGAIDAILPKVAHRTKHRESVPASDVADVIRKVQGIEDAGWRGMVGAFEFAILTAARTAEVLGIRWSEVDTDAKVWAVSASRMKANREHRVPLSARAIEVLQEARERTHGTGLVFRSPRGKQIDEAGLRRVMRRIEVDATVHGFRGTFKSWCLETGVARELAEMALAHSYMGDTEAAYVRTDLLERRRPVMERWARFVTATPAPKVVAIR